MRTVVIGPNEAGQRLDKFLHKYLKEAPPSFFYKMMRKKNILLNGSRCEGGQILRDGDELKLFLAEETLERTRRKGRNICARTAGSGRWRSFMRTGIFWR